jgi:hypothetical protein
LQRLKLSVVTRDSTSLPVLFEHTGELFVGAGNGSIRTYLQTENGKNLPLNKAMWDHTRAITCLLCMTVRPPLNPYSRSIMNIVFV